MTFNDLLKSQGLLPSEVLILRHTPRQKLEPRLRTIFPLLVTKRPDLFNAYQQTQTVNAEKDMVRAKYVASFVSFPGQRTVFAGVYENRLYRPMTRTEYWQLPAHIELKELGMRGWPEADRRSSILWFDLVLTGLFQNHRGRLLVKWPDKSFLKWHRFADKCDLLFCPPLRQSAFDVAKPNWTDVDVAALNDITKKVVDLAPCFPDEVVANQSYQEGAVRRVLVNAYERDSRAREACIAHYGYSCVVCGFDFHRTYGDLGYQYIHVHHLVDLASIRAEYDVDPVSDLRPVCPNCHAMLHKQRPAMPISQLAAILERHRRSDAQ